jgi:iron(III) transport system substrate-binding protein
MIRTTRPSTVTRALGALIVTGLLADCTSAEQVSETPAPAPVEEAAPVDADGPLVIYSGRSEALVGDILAEFSATSGIAIEVRYGDTAELASAILNEGDASPADVFFGQDAGALGALESAGRFAPLDGATIAVVDPAYRSASDAWVGVTGRVRVLAYDTRVLGPEDLPDSVTELVDERWQGRVGWAPTNGSFQAFVTALRLTAGEDAARAWLEAMVDNGTQPYEKNTAIVEAIARGEIAVGLVNHYYVLRYLAEDPDYPVANHYLVDDIGGLVNVAGVGVLATSQRPAAAAALVAFLLSEETQSTFAQRTGEAEYPLGAGVAAGDLPALESLRPPAIDLTRLEDLQGTLALLREVRVLD